MLSREETFVAAQAAWRFRETGRFPSELVCDYRGHEARTPAGAETREALQAWGDIAGRLGISPTAYMGLLLANPEQVAHALLHTLSQSPASLGWISTTGTLSAPIGAEAGSVEAAAQGE
jgi:hypothetical protein